MSAFVVSRETILTLALAAQIGGQFSYMWRGHYHKVSISDGEACLDIANKLYRENVRSYNYRYKESGDLPGFTLQDIASAGPRVSSDPVLILKQCQCLNYQSCETGDWEDTEAYAILEALKNAQLSRLPGYDDAPWGLDEPTHEIATIVRLF